MKNIPLLILLFILSISCKKELFITPFDKEIENENGIPIIHIDTDNLEIDSKEEYITGTVSVEGGRFSSDFSISTMEIRGRGNSTWAVHDKKGYQLKYSEKVPFLDLPKDKKWIFLAEHSDKTLMRNKIAFELGYLSSLDWTPESMFTDVYLNSEYNGTYHVSQKIEVSDNRVAIGDNGYLLEIDQQYRLDEDDVYFFTSRFLVNIKEPELQRNDSEYYFIRNLIREFETVLFSSYFSDPDIGYAKYIDVDSFVDWYLINEITKNQDAKSYSSIYFNVIPGEKIKMGPIWDFDLAFGNVDYSRAEYHTGFWIKNNPWYEALFKDPNFVNKVKIRFAYFKEKQNIIQDKIETYANLLELTQAKNDDKWEVIGHYHWPNPVVLDTYQEEVERLKTWYFDRMYWLDSAINNL